MKMPKIADRGLRWLCVILLLLFGGVVLYLCKADVNGIIRKLLGKQAISSFKPTVIANSLGEPIGTTVAIVPDNSLIHDTSKVTLASGIELQLPDGVKDSNVKSITIVKENTYEIELEHEKLTDVFDA